MSCPLFLVGVVLFDYLGVVYYTESRESLPYDPVPGGGNKERSVSPNSN